jgi:predicted Rossmann fold nucleotide-binding protein DprA/Smf involved in DNA uptake
MTKRITKRDRFAELRTIAEGLGRNDLVSFCDSETELLDRKRTKSGAPTKAQLVNEAVKVEITSVLDEPKRATAIASEVGISVQKATALLKQLVKSGAVARNEEGKVTTFTLV